VNSDLRHVSRVLVRTPNWVGDAVMATPALRAIREHFSQAEITWLVRDPGVQVYAGCEWFDHLVRYSHTGKHRGFLGVLKLARELRGRGKYDLCILMPNSFHSALVAVLAGARARIGYRRDGRRLLLTKSLPRPVEGGRFLPRYMGDACLLHNIRFGRIFVCCLCLLYASRSANLQRENKN